jgi:hypothetical protein
VRSEEMFIAQGTPPDPASMKAIVILIVVAAVIFWRTALKVLLIGAIMLVVVGALTAVQGLH